MANHSSIGLRKTYCRINGEGELLLYGTVGEWVDGMDALSVIEQLESLHDSEIKVRIHSEGGSIMDGLLIYNRLKQSPRKIHVTIDALAASIASVIAMAGDHVTMPENAWIMIHKPWLNGKGDAEVLRESADMLDRLELDMISIYQRKTGLSAEQIADLMAQETWLNGEQAITLGFIDEVLMPVDAAASIDPDAVSDNLKNVISIGDVDMKRLTNDEANTIVKDSAKELLRAESIRKLGALAKLDGKEIQGIIDSDLDVADARQAVMELMADRVEDGMPGRSSVRMEGSGSFYLGGGRNESPYTNPMFSAFAEALSCRHTAKIPSEQASQFMNMSTLEMAKAVLEQNGSRVWRGTSNSALIAKAMHTTADFPELLTEAGNRILMDAYSSAPSTLKQISKKNTARDFRPMSRVQISGEGGLQLVNEAGEFKHGTMFDSAESYKLDTYGQLFCISRQALVNDDLGAFTESAQTLARVASDFESQHLVDLLLANPSLSDGNELFHDSHGNLAATGAALSVGALGEGRKMMRLQKSVNNVSPLGIAPKWLVVPAALETAAEQLLSEIYAGTVAETNPFTKKLELLVEPRLDRFSENGWYLFADSAVAPVLEYSYLEGEEGPYFESRDGFEKDVMEMKLRLDFGAGVLDFRGGYHNPGE